MTALLLVGLLLLVAINGFFVAAEFALVRARRSRIEEAASQGEAGGRVALAELHEITEYLSACQLGITLASIGIGFLGEPAIAVLIEPAFGGLSHGAAAAISIAIAYLIVTAVHITVGEQVPKVWAIQRADRASNGILRLLRVDPNFGEEAGGTPEELKLLIAESYTGGKLDAGEAGMLAGVFHLHEQEARQVMTPIPAVVTCDLSESAEAALKRCVASGHTRLVVTEDENTDRIKGLVHANSLARVLMEDGPDASIAGLVRDAPIVPETKPLDDLLADLQRQRSSLAVVVDEYGRTAGLVTVEDIIEEI